MRRFGWVWMVGIAGALFSATALSQEEPPVIEEFPASDEEVEVFEPPGGLACEDACRDAFRPCIDGYGNYVLSGCMDEVEERRQWCRDHLEEGSPGYERCMEFVDNSEPKKCRGHQGAHDDDGNDIDGYDYCVQQREQCIQDCADE